MIEVEGPAFAFPSINQRKIGVPQSFPLLFAERVGMHESPLADVILSAACRATAVENPP
jgi:hypothetical protein